MFSLFKNLFNNGDDAVKAIASGARIIDVRTPEEFRSGHVKGSVNVPLDKIPAALKGFGKDEMLVVCCRSGARSARAAAIMKSTGYSNVINGGSWLNLK